MVAGRGAETAPCRVVADAQDALDWSDKNQLVEKDTSLKPRKSGKDRLVP